MGWLRLLLRILMILGALSETESWISGTYNCRTKAELTCVSEARRQNRAAPSYRKRTTSQRSIPGCCFVIGVGRRDDRATTIKLLSVVDDNAGEKILLLEMDVVVFSEVADDRGKRKLGAVQQDGRITALSAWTEEPAFDSYVELLVDEEDLLPGYHVEDGSIHIHAVVPENLLSYGSRQVNGGMGPGNPHGEESEMLYYVHKSVVDGVEVEVKPDLEVFW